MMGLDPVAPPLPQSDADRDEAFIAILQAVAPRLEGGTGSDRAWEDVLARGFGLGLAKEDMLEIAAEVLGGTAPQREQRRRCPACGEAVRGTALPEHCPRCELKLPRCPSCRAINHPLTATTCANPRCPGKGPRLLPQGWWEAFRGSSERTGSARAVPFREAPRLLWSREIGEPVVASPVVGAGVVFLAGKAGLVTAFDRSGHLFSPRPEASWPARVEGPVAATPLYHRGRLYIATLSGQVAVFDALSGRQLALASDLGPIDASPAADESSGTVVVATQQGTLLGLDLETLALRWKFPGKGDRPPGTAFRASPAIGDGALVAVTEAGEILTLDIAGSHVRERWRAWAPGEVLATPVIVKGFVCVLTKHGELTTYRLGDGRMHARGSSQDAGFVVASPALAAVDRGALVFGGADGRVHAIDYLSAQVPPGYPLQPDFPSSAPFLASAAAVGSMAILADDAGHVLGVDAERRQMAWHVNLGAPVRSSPALDGDRLYVCTEDGTLFAYAPAD